MATQQHRNPRKRARSCSDRDIAPNKVPKHAVSVSLALPIITAASPSPRKRTRSDRKGTGEPATKPQSPDKEKVKLQHSERIQAVGSLGETIESEEAYDADEEDENENDVDVDVDDHSDGFMSSHASSDSDADSGSDSGSDIPSPCPRMYFSDGNQESARAASTRRTYMSRRRRRERVKVYLDTGGSERPATSTPAFSARQTTSAREDEGDMNDMGIEVQKMEI